MYYGVVEAVSTEFAVQLFIRTAHSVSERISSLYHKSGNNSVEDKSVVEAFAVGSGGTVGTNATLGTLRRYFASYCQYSSRYDKFKEGTILNAFKPELSNGAVMDIGIYTIYPMIALFGRPQHIEAQGIVLHTGVDGQGAINFSYPGMDATVLYSKIANSFLPTEIEGEEGNLIIDQIHIARQVDFIPRIPTAQGKSQQATRQSLSAPLDHSPYYYEIKEFIDLVTSGQLESSINTLDTSLATIEVIDEIRHQLGVTYPADL